MGRVFFPAAMVWLILLSLSAQAATYNWANNSGGNWSVAANWNPNTGTPTQSGGQDVVYFGNNGGLLNATAISVNNDSTGQGANAVFFNGSINYTITTANANKLRFGGSPSSITCTGAGINKLLDPLVIYGPTEFNVTNNSTGVLTIGGEIQPATLNARFVVTFGGSGTTSLGGRFSTTGAASYDATLQKSGTGTLTLTVDPSSALTNGIIVQSGKMVLQGSTSTYRGGTTISNGAVLQIGGAANAFGDPGPGSALTNNGTLLLVTAGSTSFNYSGPIRGSGVLILDAVNRIWLQAANTYTGGTIISNGILDVSFDSALGDANGAVTFPVTANSSPGSLRTRGYPSGNANFSTSRTINLQGNGDLSLVAPGDTATFNGPLGGAGGLNIGGAISATPGTILLQGNNTYTGRTYILQGGLKLGAGATLANTTNILVRREGTFDVTEISAGFTVGSCQSVTGEGKLNGKFVFNGTLAPGDTNSGLSIPGGGLGCMTNASTLGVVFNTGSTNRFDMNITNALTSDRLVQDGGVIHLGGVLELNNKGPQPTNGTTLRLYQGTLSGQFDSMILPHGLAHWITTDLGSSGTLMFANRAPQAVDLEFGLEAGTTATFRIIGGKPTIAPSDPEGDSLYISRVQNPSQAGRAVTTDGTNVVYSAGMNDNGQDTFSYVVSDSFGAATTNTITANVAGTSLNVYKQHLTATSEPAFTIAGIPGASYTVDHSTNLVEGIGWTNVTQIVIPLDGQYEFIHTNVIGSDGTHFYRTRALGAP